VTAPAYVNLGNVAAVAVSGTTEAGASIALVVTDAGAAHTVTKTMTANGTGAWNAAVDLSSLNAGTVTYRAVATDTAGNQGNPATPGTATSVKDVIAPTVSNVTLADGGGKDGKIEPKDRVTIQLSEAVDASTICSAWAADAGGTVSGDKVTVTVSSGNVLKVTVDSSACPTSRIGTVGLGVGTSYATGTVTYKGPGVSASALTWDPTAKTLTVTLGALATGSPATGTVQPAFPSYTPEDGIKDIAGNPLATAEVQATAKSRF
jgi:hypothetical protein